MCDDIPDFQLFKLHPTSNKTTNIVRTNQMVSQVPFGQMNFLIRAKQVSRKRKGMINFGRELDNDVIYQQTGHNRYLCVFTLTSIGDLFFIDASGIRNLPQTAIIATSTGTTLARGAKAQHIDNEGLDIRLEIGRGCRWKFEWCVPLNTLNAVAHTRALLRRIFVAAPHRYFVEDPRIGASKLPVPVALHMRQPPETHWYGSLPREEPRRMYESVDLRTGKLYAVKRLIGPSDQCAMQAWKRLARLQAMSFDALNHPNIQVTHFIDGWAENHTALDLYRHPYPGNSCDLLNAIREPAIRIPSFAAHIQSDVRKVVTGFVVQLLSELLYLDRHCIVHGNIKPENVLYQNISHLGPGNYLSQRLVRFFLVDFAFGEAGTQIGTVGYMAPETVKYHTRSSKTDHYVLGVTILELLGVLDVAEFSRGSE
ncbi:hypothetical protein NLG97_g680 [Lecanicillium saksenae]|uniref:Uncharacterized protein n=1 Tax=Lecanicillium saksenae TaxID=468837 RepID=A0ACC1R639_9HYPO|nr:hypothetical protein NLG97_g680 [Lecanicillium saksenae]